MKTKKTVIAVLTATLLIFALLVSSCMELADDVQDNDKEDNYQVPPGKGLVKFKISKKSLTIFPTIDTDDMYFAFEFKDTVGSADVIFPDDGTAIPLTNDAAAFTVPEGKYWITINAYNDDSCANLIATKEEKNNVGPGAPGFYEVKNGVACDFSTTLTGISDTGTGTFAYNITVPGSPVGRQNTASGKFSLGAQTLKVYPYPYTGPSQTPTLSKDFSSDPLSITGVSIPVGAYVIRVEFEMGYCQNVVVTEVMHVYQNLTTSFPGVGGTAVTVPTNFKQNKFTVKYDMDSVPITNGSVFADVEVNNAQKVTQPNTGGGSPVDIDPIPTSSSGKTFAGWWSNPGRDEPWTWNKKIYTDDVKIYAAFSGGVTTGSGSITINFTKPQDIVKFDIIYRDDQGDDLNDPTPNTYTQLSLQDLDNGYTVDITIKNVAAGTKWMLGSGTDVTSDVNQAVDASNIPIPDSYTLIISDSVSWFDELTPGNNYIYVTGTDTASNSFAAAININAIE